MVVDLLIVYSMVEPIILEPTYTASTTGTTRENKKDIEKPLSERFTVPKASIVVMHKLWDSFNHDGDSLKSFTR